jgi:hypothetical protein
MYGQFDLEMIPNNAKEKEEHLILSKIDKKKKKKLKKINNNNNLIFETKACHFLRLMFKIL